LTVNLEPDLEAQAESDRKVVLGLISAVATVTIVGVGLSLTMTLIALRLGEQGFSAWAIGLNPTAGGFAILAGAAFAPALVSRLRVKTLLVLALLASGVSLLSFAVTSGYWAWLGIRAVFSGALSVLFVTSEYWINAIAPPRQRGFVLGFYMTCLASGFAIGPGILGFVGAQGSLPFLVAAALFALAALPITLWSGTLPALEKTKRGRLLGFFTTLPVATFAALLHGAIEAASLSLLPIYALRANLSAETGAFFVTLFAFGNVIFQFPIGFASDQMDRRKLLAAITFLGFCGAVALAFLGPSHFVLFCSLLVVWGGIVGSLYAVGLAYIGSYYSGPDLASANAGFVMLYSLGMLGGPPLAGFGMDLSPLDGLFLSIALMHVLYFTLARGRGSVLP